MHICTKKLMFVIVALISFLNIYTYNVSADSKIVYLSSNEISEYNLDTKEINKIFATTRTIDRFWMSRDGDIIVYSTPEIRGLNRLYCFSLIDNQEMLMLGDNNYFGLVWLNNKDFVVAYNLKSTGDLQSYYSYVRVANYEATSMKYCTTCEAQAINTDSIVLYPFDEPQKAIIVGIDGVPKKIIELPEEMNEISCPTLSPDGNYLAYYDKRENGMGFVLYSLRTKTVICRSKLIYNIPGDFMPIKPIWSENSESVISQSSIHGVNDTIQSNIVRLCVDGSKCQMIKPIYTDRQDDMTVMDYHKGLVLFALKDKNQSGYSLHLVNNSCTKKILENVKYAQFVER